MKMVNYTTLKSRDEFLVYTNAALRKMNAASMKMKSWKESFVNKGKGNNDRWNYHSKSTL